MIRFAIAIGFLALNFYIYNYFASSAVIPPRESFESFPRDLGDWSCTEAEKMQDDVQENLGVTDYILCDFFREEPRGRANLYIGYHATQVREEGGGAGENSIHPPSHCLPGSGWDIIQNETVPLEIEGLPQQPATVKRLVIAKGNSRQLVYYWYQSRGRVISEDWHKILYVGLDRARLNRTDGSLVRFTVPILRENDEVADATFRDLAPHVLTKLASYVPE